MGGLSSAEPTKWTLKNYRSSDKILLLVGKKKGNFLPWGQLVIPATAHLSGHTSVGVSVLTCTICSPHRGDRTLKVVDTLTGLAFPNHLMEQNLPFLTCRTAGI